MRRPSGTVERQPHFGHLATPATSAADGLDEFEFAPIGLGLGANSLRSVLATKNQTSSARITPMIVSTTCGFPMLLIQSANTAKPAINPMSLDIGGNGAQLLFGP